MTGTKSARWDTLSADDPVAVRQWLDMLVPPSPGVAPPCVVDLVGSLRFAPPDVALEDRVLRLSDRVVGVLRLSFPDGAPVARVDQLVVAPDLRRTGLGRTLLDMAVDRARAHGRQRLTTVLDEPVREVSEENPATAFAAAVDAEREDGVAGLHQWLDLLADDRPAIGSLPVPAGYEVRTWGTTTPDEHVADLSALEIGLGTTPLDGPPEDGGRAGGVHYARQFERMRVGRGRRAYHAGAISLESGRLVGYTSISKTTGNPEHALQGMTVVHTTHRGHGLGRVLKVANLAHARRAEPALRWVETTNDEDNEPMIGINAWLGFRPCCRRVSWRLPV
jgi:GNAT superfamily N-acetyltransferase